MTKEEVIITGMQINIKPLENGKYLTTIHVHDKNTHDDPISGYMHSSIKCEDINEVVDVVNGYIKLNKEYLNGETKWVN